MISQRANIHKFEKQQY